MKELSDQSYVPTLVDGNDSPYGADNVVLSDPLAVPEPATLMLFAGGALAFTLFRARRR